MPRHTTPLLWAFLATLALAGAPAFAEPHEGGERHEHLDARHAHNHSYLDRGVIVTAVPRGAYSVRFGGGRYWFHGGVWYRAEGPRFIVIAPPVGIVVDVLPPFFTTLRIGTMQYYYANDTYYVYNSSLRGFQVVEPPGGVDPNGAPAAVAPPPPPGGADNVFIYPKNGQSPEQQATDRYECHRWAAEQTGFDPTRDGGGVAPDQVARKRSDYLRADGACLEGRGYTVR